MGKRRRATPTLAELAAGAPAGAPASRGGSGGGRGARADAYAALLAAVGGDRSEGGNKRKPRTAGALAAPRGGPAGAGTGVGRGEPKRKKLSLKQREELAAEAEARAREDAAALAAEADETDSGDEGKGEGVAATSAVPSVDPFRVHLNRDDVADVTAMLASGRPPLVHKCAAPELAEGAVAASDVEPAPCAGRPRAAYAVKARLLARLNELDPGAAGADVLLSDPLAQLSYDAFHDYRDAIVTPRRPPVRLAPGAVGDAYLLHCINHVLKTRDTVAKNTEKEADAQRRGDAAFEPQRDQGFTRPKVLLLLPNRNAAWRAIRRLLEMCPASQTVEVVGKDRLDDGFGPGEETDSDADTDDESGSGSEGEGAGEGGARAAGDGTRNSITGNAAAGAAERRARAALRKERRKARARRRAKPDDFRALFSGNNDDNFVVGIKFTRKSVRLFAGLYGADIIVASPLGLVVRIERGSVPPKGKDGKQAGKQAGKGGKSKKEGSKFDRTNKDDVDLTHVDAPGTCDYLSSIEIAVVDHAHMLSLQNWAHVSTVMDSLSEMPSSQRDADLTRARHAYLSGLGRHLRQTIVLAEWETPAMRAVIERGCASAAGRVRLHAPTSRHACAARRAPLGCRQQFERVAASSASTAADALFDRFDKSTWPAVASAPRSGAGGDGTLVLCSTYADFTRLRAFFASPDAKAIADVDQCAVVFVSEYSSDSETARSKAAFATGKAGVLVYTERAHFYRRQQIRGASAVVFYGLPSAPRTYEEVLRFTQGATAPQSHALYTRFDALALKRIVGDARGKTMLNSDSRASVIAT